MMTAARSMIESDGDVDAAGRLVARLAGGPRQSAPMASGLFLTRNCIGNPARRARLVRRLDQCPRHARI